MGAFVDFMGRIVEADTHTLTINLAGRFTPTEQEHRNALLADELNKRLVARAQAAGVLRNDISADDLTYVNDAPDILLDIRQFFRALR